MGRSHSSIHLGRRNVSCRRVLWLRRHQRGPETQSKGCDEGCIGIFFIAVGIFCAFLFLLLNGILFDTYTYLARLIRSRGLCYAVPKRGFMLSRMGLETELMT